VCGAGVLAAAAGRGLGRKDGRSLLAQQRVALGGEQLLALRLGPWGGPQLHLCDVVDLVEALVRHRLGIEAVDERWRKHDPPAEAVLRTIEPQLPLCLARDARQVLAAGDRDARRRGYQVGGAHQQRQPARLAQARLQQR
jgi:hypothetical protein